jgi:hypothetical protein
MVAMFRSRWWKVCGLLALCVTISHAEDGPAREGRQAPVYLPAPNNIEARIIAALSEKTDVSFAETSLADAVNFLRDFHQINILIDRAALQDEGIDPSTPVSLELSGVSLRSALRLLLDPYGLTAFVDAEVLTITTKTRAQEKVVTRVYPVSDLAELAEELEALQEAIQTATHKQWNRDDDARPGTMSIVPRSRSLVIRQQFAVHDEIVELLTNLRAAQTLSSPTTVLQPVNSLPTY